MSAARKYKNFISTKFLSIQEINCSLEEFRHQPSGASILHLKTDDPENLFCLSFQTWPSSSNGVAHILEHTVLCGSKMFPVKDPFFSMTRRSLSTFMNALTGPDFTCYPASTQIEKDFYNLLDVYLDAVFNPQLRRESFLQEGHRLEFSEPENPSTPLVRKGIVFNEMKGAFATPETRFWHTLMETLLPDLPYAHSSGGDPKHIPSLTYEQLKQFHHTYYHPSRCLFFFYGNLPIEKHLDFIEEKTLQFVTHKPPLPPVASQRRFSSPLYKQAFYPALDTNTRHNHWVSQGWLTCPLADQETVLALTVLDAILMETDASLLKRVLLRSGLCKAADSYLDTEMSEVPYVILLKGCEEKDRSKIEALIFETLTQIAAEGIPSHLIEAAIHQIEFSRTEITGDHMPYGLSLFMRSALMRQHGCLPESGLKIHTLFDTLLKQSKNRDFFPQLIQKFLLNNRHTAQVILSPDPHLAKKEEEHELQELLQIQKHLTKSDQEALVKQAQVLEKDQKEKENQSLDCLPKVGLEDIPALTREFPLKQHQNTFFHSCFTNNIIYADLVFDLPIMTQEDLPYLQLLASILPELGAGGRNYQQNLENIQAHTGGIAALLSLHVQTEHPNQMRPALILRGKALHRKEKELFQILSDFSKEVDLADTARIKELLHQMHSGLQNKLTKNALRYASLLSTASFSEAATIHEAWTGLSFFHFIDTLVKTHEIEQLTKQLKALYQRLISKPTIVLSCNDPELYLKIEDHYFSGPWEKPLPWKSLSLVSSTLSQARPIASPVAFTAVGYRAPTYLHPQAPAIALASQIMENRVLHPKIREQGGAYGSGISFSPMLGQMTFYSYRDPHLASTLKAFQEAIRFVCKHQFDETDLEEAKIGIIQSFDAPVAPGSRAFLSYGWLRDGKTTQHKQNYRNALLSMDAQSITEAVNEILLPQIETGVIISFAGQKLFEKETLLMEKPLPIIPI